MNVILSNVTRNRRELKRETKTNRSKQTLHKQVKFLTYGTQQSSQMTGTLTIFLAAVAVGLIGALALLQAYFIGQCFMAGQPQENGYYNDCL